MKDVVRTLESVLFALLSFVSIVFSVVGANRTFANWPMLGQSSKVMLIAVSSVLTALYAFELRTGWHAASTIFNAVQGWATVGCYTLLILLFRTLRPQWLTRTLSVVLFLPMGLAFVVLPLSVVSYRSDARLDSTKMGHDFFFTRTRYDAGAFGSSGYTVSTYYQPSRAPFLVRSGSSIRFDDGKCNASQSFAVLEPDHKHVIARCPWYLSQNKKGYRDVRVPTF